MTNYATPYIETVQDDSLRSALNTLSDAIDACYDLDTMRDVCLVLGWGMNEQAKDKRNALATLQGAY